MYDPKIHHRKSIRLQDYDYSQCGAYFVTICCHEGYRLLGEIADGQVVLNEYGKIVLICWFDLVNHYHHIELDEFVIMPNHVHGIIIILEDEPVGAGLKPAPTTTDDVKKRHGIPEIVRGFKSFSSRRINELRQMKGFPVWQRNYYEHIIRNEESLGEIREYIRNNPMAWEMDEYFKNCRC